MAVVCHSASSALTSPFCEPTLSASGFGCPSFRSSDLLKWSTIPAPIESPNTLIVVRKRSLETRCDKTQLKIKVAFKPWWK